MEQQDKIPPLYGLTYHKFNPNSRDKNHQDYGEDHLAASLEDADLISSKVAAPAPQKLDLFGFENDEVVETHKLVLDIDLPAKLIPSTTPDHYHLYIDKEIPADKYWDLVQAFVDAGLVEEGYLGASMRRGYTSARLPWVRKPVRSDYICIGCNREPQEINEYVRFAAEEGLTPDEFVRRSEGTLNRFTGHFWCTACYIEAGQPMGVAP